MSLRLSSLLNPSPESESHEAQPAPKQSLPPIQYVQSPEQGPSGSPASPPSGQHSFSYPPSTAHEAARALAALSTSPILPPPTWYSYPAQDQTPTDRRSSFERRPGSGYGEPIQLPPPGDLPRKMSSPTLEQYHVSPRSPEGRRGSIISPLQAAFTLPPIQTYNSAPAEIPQPASSGQDSSKYAANVDASGSFSSNSSPVGQGEVGKPVISYDRTPSHAIAPSQQAPPFGGTSAADSAEQNPESSPTAVKQEKFPTPQPPATVDSTPTDATDSQTMKAVASLKNEHGLRTQTTLRDSSVPIQSTESGTSEPPTSAQRKRPAPTKTKKGTATTMKRAPPAKKRKVEPKLSVTPSRASEASFGRGANGKGTPLDSSPAPSTRSQSADPDEPYDDGDDEDGEDVDDDPNGALYCICRKPDNGAFMIGCDGTCDDWFHGKCVGVEERDKNLIDKYICPACTKGGVGRTTWKRVCRRQGCRQPAKVNKKGGGGSKYCSDECGVLFFRDMIGRTRGREETVKNRASRRKASAVASGPDRPLAPDDDLGPRGGVLAAGEVKTLLNACKTADDFRRLGSSVLSPPATPGGSERPEPSGDEFTRVEADALERITAQKGEARHRHGLLKDRMLFVTMAKQAASRTATEKDLKPKDYCGYDSRLEWTEAQFHAWRNSSVGQQAFELETLATENTAGDTDMTAAAADNNDDGVDGDDFEICDRKKCARHLEWSKLAVDDLRFEMSDNGDRMRALDKEERELRAQAALRAKVGQVSGQDSVQVHDLGAAPPHAVGDEMEVDTSPGIRDPMGASTSKTVALPASSAE